MNSPSNIMSDYRSLVERMFDEKSSIIFSNKDRDHAAVLISTLFSRAKNSVAVLTRSLDGEFYNRPDVSQAVLGAARRGVRIRIKVQEQPHPSNLRRQLEQQHAENVEIITCHPESKMSQMGMNFTVMDETGFRLEEDRNTSSAVACANKPELAKQILNLFETIE